MPRAFGIKQLIAPNQGLVTEQSKLTPVEGSTVDEINFTYNDDGSIRRRRIGINKEPGASFYTLSEIVNDTNATAYAKWESVAGIGGTTFHVFQIGATLFFIKDAEGNLTSQRKSFVFDLDTAVTSAYTSVEDVPVDMTTGAGRLYVVSKKIDPFYIEYDSSGDSISATYVGIGIRDLTGIDDSLAIDERPATLSESHDYNLNNQGWWQQRRIAAGGAFIDPIVQFDTTNGDFPSNADIALLGMVDDGTGNILYDPDYLLELTLGNTPAPKGHFIIDPFNINYEALRSGTGGSGGYGGAVGSSGDADTGGDSGDPNWWEQPAVPPGGDIP